MPSHFLLPISAWGVQVLLEACKFLAIVITLEAGVKGVKSLLIGLNDHGHGKPAAQPNAHPCAKLAQM
jgi:hypothetical protein